MTSVDNRRLTAMEPIEIIARARGAELCVHAFGDPGEFRSGLLPSPAAESRSGLLPSPAAGPAILLIQGSGGAMDWWEDDLCRRLAAGPRLVIRYDHRDTGRSTSYPPGEPGYTGRDLAEDALAVLDALSVTSAHIVGLSMGGALAQVIALDHPERVRSLTLIATSPVAAPPGEAELPRMTDELAATFAAGDPEPDWSDRAAAVAHLVDSFRPYTGSGPFDETHLRSIAETVVDRSLSLASAGNHTLIDPGPPPARTLPELSVPVLVIHGAEDPLFPVAHGHALARLIPGAELLVLDRTGHELPRSTWDTVVPALLAHTTGHLPCP